MDPWELGTLVQREELNQAAAADPQSQPQPEPLEPMASQSTEERVNYIAVTEGDELDCPVDVDPNTDLLFQVSNQLHHMNLSTVPRSSTYYPM